MNDLDDAMRRAVDERLQARLAEDRRRRENRRRRLAELSERRRRGLTTRHRRKLNRIDQEKTMNAETLTADHVAELTEDLTDDDVRALAAAVRIKNVPVEHLREIIAHGRHLDQQEA